MQKERIPTIHLGSLSENGPTELLIRPFADYLEKHHKNLALPHRHNFYHVVFFTKGSGQHTIDFTSFDVVPHQIYFMIPGQVHSWNFEGETDGFVVNFTESLFNSFLLKADYLETFSFFNGVAPDGVINLPENTAVEVDRLLKKALKQTALRGHLADDLARILLLEVFLLVEQSSLRAHTETIPHYHDSLLKNYQKLVEKNYLTLRLPKEYADRLNITPNHLNALCKEHLGMQAGELIRNRIFLEAKRLLVNLEMSVSQVGYALGFQDNSYFTRAFKKHTSLTPEEFRKKHS